MFRATRVDPESSIDPSRQIAFYIPGIGTSLAGKQLTVWRRFKSIADQAVGGGLEGKIVQCYVAIISAWRPGDRIYLFGFSRGAYTVRCLAHVLELMGIPTASADGSPISLDPKKLYPLAKSAVRILYRRGLTTTDDPKRDAKADAFRALHKSYHGADIGAVPYFIGVWDTVSAIGWSSIFRGRDDRHLPKDTMFARHALAVDEYRRNFVRVPWGGSGTVRPAAAGEPRHLEQVWFAGNHSDIGGSYPENESRLSDISLDWMTNFVEHELPEISRVFIDRRRLRLHPAADGMMHDECMVGVGGTRIPWRKCLRTVDQSGQLHKSVFERLRCSNVRNFTTYGPYRPANLAQHTEAKAFWNTPS